MMGETLASLQTDLDGRIAYATVSREDFERTGAIPPDTEDLVDFTVSLRGVEVGLLFIEQKRGGIKFSIRSRAGFDCSEAGRPVRRRGPQGRLGRDAARPALGGASQACWRPSGPGLEN